MADLAPTESVGLSKAAATRYLPAEMLNLIAEQVPQEVYVVMTTFAPNVNSFGYHSRDEVKTEMIGIFGTLELANRAAEAYLEQRIKPFVRADRSYGHILSDRTETNKLEDGTVWLSLTERHGGHTSFVQTFRETICNDMWRREEMPLPRHCYRKHDSKCPCCNTPEELEAVQNAEAKLQARILLRSKKRRMMRVTEQLTKISEELEELKKDKTLDTVNLEEDTEVEDEDYEVDDELDLGSENDDENEE